ncbi:UbiD family decarboxylase [Rhodoplanes roseus]|uniref:3-octaprenyl-4-hydroxybenzoate carboxy-lyase n=1 Tax=Rhodoplanes roseus TaxID=29409 RepID=A0A327KYH7_9BRAD|nr:UbiD family decarboxylase [Rhodoplanes roseus]RAI43084.1 3-octaprenyl-4-hydroxybenzoate carboxy-lyase [Rhodoplanes roseus]
MPIRDFPPFRDLRDFLRHLDAAGDVARVTEPVAIVHDMAEIHRRVIARDGPALVFERPRDASGRILPVPVVVNLFGTRTRVAAGLGIKPERLAELGEALASLREPQPVDGFRDALARLPILRAAMRTRAETVDRPVVQEEIRLGADVDLGALPVQTCWPGEAGPLITWPVVVTRPPDSEAVAGYNLGIYRMQVLGRDRAIMRWLHHRGGAKHHAQWAAQGKDMPVAVAIGTDPATMLTAVLPLPETLSEVRFSGLLRGARPRLAAARTVPLMVPADAEIVIEGYVSPTETAAEGPFGDHTGYYNSVEQFPVMRVTAITTRRDPTYLSTFTGRAPDEPAVLGSTFNELFLPIVKRAFPEIVDVWLPPHACSYRMAIISIRKRYPGHAKRIMMGLWGMLPQFTYTKLIVVVDDDVDPKSWDDVAWAISTRCDPSRDLTVIDRTPIDYLDFASPLSGLGGKLGIDATNKIGTETTREWGQVLKATPDLIARVDALWPKLGL